MGNRFGLSLNSQKRIRAWVLLPFLLLPLQWLIHSTGLLNRMELLGYDFLQQHHFTNSALHPDIAIILIDEASLQALDPIVGRYPWPRSLYADLIEFLQMGEAKAVLFDILYSERQSNSQHPDRLSESDRRFAEVSQQSGITFHAFQPLRESYRENIVSPRPLPNYLTALALTNISGVTDQGNNSYLAPFKELSKAAKGIGVVEIEPDTDGIYRRIRLFTRYNDKVYPSLGVSPLIQTNTPIKISAAQINLRSTRIPIDKEQKLHIRLAGQYNPYSMAGVFSSIQQLQQGNIEKVTVFPDEFSGKYVFIGASAIGLADLKATAMDPLTPGVFLHASVLSNLLSQQFLVPAKPQETLFISYLLIILTIAAILTTQRLYWQLSIPLILAAIYITGVIYYFKLGVVYQLAEPMVAIFLALSSCFTYLTFSEGRAKDRVRTLFSRYVSPEVLSQVVDRLEDEEIEALTVSSRENITVLFSDIRGFTSISESMQPEQVVDMLNTYFEVMTEITFRYRGTLDKFIGDAIMAFWGAPIRNPEHARNATLTAMAMMGAMKSVNTLLKDKGYQDIKIGIGVHSDSVILGNIGSQRKMDYTVIGDGVNLASRLEGLSKPYQTPIILSEETYHQITGSICCVIIDRVRVKGKQQPLAIYTPLAEMQSADILKQTHLAEKASAAFFNYQNQHWDDAIRLYRELTSFGFSPIFIERCEKYLQEPPPADWDGIFTLLEK